MKNCLECGSQRIIPNVKALDYNDGAYYDLKISVDENPQAFIFKNRNYSDVKAKVCADCGFIHFFAGNPEILWSTYQKSRKKV
jgi:ferredoxin-like protein FixX